MKYQNIGSTKLVILVDDVLRVVEANEIIEAKKVLPNPALVAIARKPKQTRVEKKEIKEWQKQSENRE